MSPFRGKRTVEDLSKLLSHFLPQVGRKEEKAGKNIFHVSKDKLVQEVICPSLKIG
jgi:hypothetical protein